MLWDKFGQIREIISLFFCIGFSISSLVWNGNFAVKAVAKTQTVSNSISSSLDSVGGFFKSAYNKIESFETLRKERDSYAKLVDEYKILPQDILNLRAENDALRKELSFTPKSEYPTIKAEVLSIRLNSIYRTIIINKGKDHGIHPYMPVIGRAIDESTSQPIQAVVGKVIAVSASSSVVQPIINSSFSMGVQIPKTDIWATLSGNSGKTMESVLNYIDAAIIIDPKYIGSKQIGPSLPPTSDSNFADLMGSLGRAVYSSSSGGIFPPNIPVGIITEEGPRSGSFKTAYVKPFIKFEDLQFVTIIKKLPEKWVEDWPEEKTISIENPYYGELNFPGEVLEQQNQAKKINDAKSTKTIPPTPPKKKTQDDEIEEMVKKLEAP
jgi:rod shape-determining protein MreC